MSKIVRTVRFIVGLAMVAGGASLASPFVTSVVVAHSRSGPPTVATFAAPFHAEQAWAAQGPGGHTIPEPGQRAFFADSNGPDAGNGMGGFAADQQLASAVAMAVPSAARAHADYHPPQPPPPLPAVASGASHPLPGLDQTYRSTLDIPPPPLLDAQSPPPLAVAWSAHDVREAHASQPSAFVPTPPAAAAAMPAVYTVRDGDDLTGIATRLYGHPGGAAAIWSANRDRLANPDLLPIGLQLRLPPAWTVSALQTSRSHGGPAAIEPGPAIVAAEAAGAHPPASVGSGMTAGGAGPIASADQRHPGWLGQTGRPMTPAITPTAFSPVSQSVGRPVGYAGGPRPRSVLVVPGDTLASIAERFYGDRSVAERIWDVNRDRLRSPELVVIGMELRLP
jgi:nucleoid-associated protein YgaU